MFSEVTGVQGWQLPAGHHRQLESEVSSARASRCGRGWSKPPRIPCKHGPWRDTAEKAAECVIIEVIIPSLTQGLSWSQVNSRTLQKPSVISVISVISDTQEERLGHCICSSPNRNQILHQPAHKDIKLNISVLSSLHLLGYYLGTFLLWRLETT